MKRWIALMISCSVTFSLTICLIQYTGHILDPRNAEAGFDVIEAFDLLDDNSLDVIIYGSSHAWCGCDTRVMYDNFGLKAYNYGCNWQSINTILLFLQDSLRTQKPKVVCIEVGLVNNIEQDVDLNGQIYYTRSMVNFEGKREYLKQCFGNDIKRYISYYMPLVVFHDNWTAINQESFSSLGPQYFLDTRGYNVSTVVNSYEIPDYRNFQQQEIDVDCIEVLNRIVELCREKNIHVIFYTCPYAGEYFYGEAMKKYANENNCVYFNLFEYIDEMGLSGEKDLQDAGHLNESGAGKVATFLAEYIMDEIW